MFGDQIYRQTKIITEKHYECKTTIIKIFIRCHANHAQSSTIEFIDNGPAGSGTLKAMI
jgi:hypothetical protein